MAVGDVCSRNVVIVFRNDTVADACRLMRERHVGEISDLAVMVSRGVTREQIERAPIV